MQPKHPSRSRRLPGWFPYFDLACVLAAAGLWYVSPAGIPWTLPLTLALAPWLTRWLLVGRPTRRTPFDWPLALFLLTAAVAVWAAYDRTYAWQKFWWIAGGILLFYALVNARSLWSHRGPAAADLRLWGLTAFGVSLSFYFMTTHDWTATPSAVPLIDRWGAQMQQFLPTLVAHRLNANVAGGMLAFVAPFTAVLFLTAGELERRSPAASVAAGAALLLILWVLLLTVSRGAWLALAAALALWLLWRAGGRLGRLTLPPRRRQSRRYRFRRQSALFGLLLGLLLAVPLLAALIGGQGLWLWLAQWLPASLADLDRLAMWRGGLVLASDYPFTGSGLGSFMMLYSTYSLLLHVGHTFHAHNLYLNVALEQGLPALLLLGWTWLLVGAAWVRWLRPLAPEVKGAVYSPALGAAALALVTILLHGFLDDAFYGSRALLLFFVPLAFAVPRGRSQPAVQTGTKPLPAIKKRPLLLSATLLLLALLFFGRNQLLGAWYANLGAVAQSRAELAAYSWPEWDIQDRLRQEADLQPAVAYFQRALNYQPQQATAQRRLGLIALAQADYPAALAHLQTAYRLTPWDNATRQWLGEAYVVNGRVHEGAALWSTVLNDNGQLAIRLYWYRQVNDPQRLAWVQEAVSLAQAQRTANGLISE